MPCSSRGMDEPSMYMHCCGSYFRYCVCGGAYVRLLGVRVVVFGVVPCFGNFNHLVVWC